MTWSLRTLWCPATTLSWSDVLGAPFSTTSTAYNGTYLNSERVEDPDAAATERRRGHRRGPTPLGWRAAGAVAPTSGSPLVAEVLSVVTKGGKVLLDHVSLTLPAGTLTAVIGPSGAGKSTLLGALNGLRPATSGSVRWLGRDLYQEYEQLRLHLGYVPQEDIQHPQLKVRDAFGTPRDFGFPPTLPRPSSTVGSTRWLMRCSSRAGSTAGRDWAFRWAAQAGVDRDGAADSPPDPVPGRADVGPGPGPGHHGDERTAARPRRCGTDRVVVTHSVLALEVCDLIVVMAEGGESRTSDHQQTCSSSSRSNLRRGVRQAR